LTVEPHVHHDGHEHHEPVAAPTERASTRPLALALAITLVILVVEVAGGILTGSLALLADAGHMATDAAALALSVGAAWLARRPATATRSFGYRRAEILAALVNASALLAVTVYIFWEAFQRLSEPPEVESGPMLLVACAGLLANALSAWVLARGGGHEHDLNTRGAYLHVVGDMLGSFAAIAAALVMLATGWYLADPILSAGIGLLILASAWRLLREAVDVLLEAAPAGVDAGAIREAIVAVPGVAGVHDLHVWSITSGFVALSGHVEVTGARPWAEVLQELAGLLAEQFGIGHVTLQPEDPAELAESFRGCSFDSPEGLAACRARVALGRADRHAHTGHRH
jgi:cobalt-zinc-cadmium efflux system protein